MSILEIANVHWKMIMSNWYTQILSGKKFYGEIAAFCSRMKLG